MQATLYVFDDRKARDWQPLSLTRPVGELLYGVFTMRARAERVLGLTCAGYLGCDGLAGFDEAGAPRVLTEQPATDRARVFLCARAVPAWQGAPQWPAESAAIYIGDALAGWYCAPGAPNPSTDALSALTATGDGAALQLSGSLLTNVWELISGNSAQLVRDFDAMEHADGVSAGERAGQFQAIGFRSGLLRIGAGVTIEPNVLLDFSNGPIWLDDAVTVRAFTRLAGPAYVGHESVLLGGSFCSVSIGPVCKVHGEMEETVVLGYSNKAHEGFLGHAYLGRWVNLGAMTTNSDLKNNYGKIDLWTPGGQQDTGAIKLGALFGDHVKTGIGSLINTGTVIGAGSSLYGSDLSPKLIPPFSWGNWAEPQGYDIEKFLETAEIAMSRRDVRLSDDMRGMLRRVWSAQRADASANAGD